MTLLFTNGIINGNKEMLKSTEKVVQNLICGGRILKKFIKMFSPLMFALMIAVSAVIIPSSAASVKLNKNSVKLITGSSTMLNAVP